MRLTARRKHQQTAQLLQNCLLAALNTSYLTDSYIIFTLKMESVSKNTIFGLKMMVKSGLEKFILKSLRAGQWLFLIITEFLILSEQTFQWAQEVDDQSSFSYYITYTLSLGSLEIVGNKYYSKCAYTAHYMYSHAYSLRSTCIDTKAQI